MTESKDTSSDKLTASQESTELTDIKNTTAQADSLTQDDTDSSMIEETESDDLDETVADTACAQPPEAKAKIESLAPDVVVASLETSDPEESTAKNESQAVHSEERPIQEDPKLETPQEVDLPEQENDESTTHQSSADNTNTQDEINIEEDQEEEVKEEKEEKLESYKQFVAEQFSNKKVDYPEVRVTIEANALPSRMYFIMNILSAIIASYGLVTNSAAVVIGAMLVAMMLGPITGVALAIIDHRMPLLRKSILTVLSGVTLVILVGFIVGWLHKDQSLTAEILSRTQPTSMDLMIALAGGTAGAYAMVSPHLSVAVVGVAVATALVPPLAASGILFAHGEPQMGLGALLLAATNIIAIQFTNALVLWILGFRRLVDDDYQSNTYFTFLQRNAVTLLLLGGLGTYLTINLQTNAKQQAFENTVKETITAYFTDKGNVLTNTQFDVTDNRQVVRAIIRGETTPSAYDVRQIETKITQDMAENFPKYLPIKLQLRYLPVQVIESDPLIKDKLDETDAAILTNSP
ncbi:TIGR00341 family protein [Psychrobacter alimentarius]|uniref:TIGR00341 family protein n=1 Tax=Psychrobacter alimentarius TaxID=261164 RepID=UPI0019188B9F|nr:TIGR00341 family protein [Psychrobacter alimentarius]